MILWRISEIAELDGAGGLIVAGRWHSKGRRIVYAAESSALAMLEVLVHLEVERLPAPFQLLKIEAPDGPVAHWDGTGVEDEAACRAWGDSWLEKARTLLAKVPSAVAPGSFNWLVNPAHPDAAAVKLLGASRWPWDRRLFKP